jgi:hypothetical protein
MVLGWRCGSSTGFVHALQSTKPGVQTLAPTQKKKKGSAAKSKSGEDQNNKSTLRVYMVCFWQVFST